MANRYVRIYEGPENTNVIGFSASAVPEERDHFEDFMGEIGYETERYMLGGENANPEHTATIQKLGGVSMAYFGIEPPLRTEDELRVVEWMADHVYTSHNAGYLIDNRMTPSPLRAFHNTDQRIIGRW